MSNLKCLAAACDVVDVMVNELGRTEQSGSFSLRSSHVANYKSGIYLRHGPEAQKVFTTFAAAFLVKV